MNMLFYNGEGDIMRLNDMLKGQFINGASFGADPLSPDFSISTTDHHISFSHLRQCCEDAFFYGCTYPIQNVIGYHLKSISFAHSTENLPTRKMRTTPINGKLTITIELIDAKHPCEIVIIGGSESCCDDCISYNVTVKSRGGY